MIPNASESEHGVLIIRGELCPFTMLNMKLTIDLRTKFMGKALGAQDIADTAHLLGRGFK